LLRADQRTKHLGHASLRVRHRHLLHPCVGPHYQSVAGYLDAEAVAVVLWHHSHPRREAAKPYLASIGAHAWETAQVCASANPRGAKEADPPGAGQLAGVSQNQVLTELNSTHARILRRVAQRFAKHRYVMAAI